MRKVKMIVCSRCNKEKPFHSKTFCRSCYGFELTKDKRVDCTVCGKKNAKYGGKNICSSCVVTRSKIKNNTPERKKIRAEKEKARRAALGEIYRSKERERNRRRKDQKTGYNKKWQKDNKEYLANYRKKYRNEINPNGVKAWEENRRAYKKGSGYVSKKEWEDILQKYNHSCFYCKRTGIPLEQEHKIPLSRGGKHEAGNVVPACRSCNASKYTKTDEEFMAKMF